MWVHPRLYEPLPHSLSHCAMPNHPPTSGWAHSTLPRLCPQVPLSTNATVPSMWPMASVLLTPGGAHSVPQLRTWTPSLCLSYLGSPAPWVLNCTGNAFVVWLPLQMENSLESPSSPSVGHCSFSRVRQCLTLWAMEERIRALLSCSQYCNLDSVLRSHVNWASHLTCLRWCAHV